MTGSCLAAVQLYSTCMVFSAGAAGGGYDAQKQWYADLMQGPVGIGHVEGSTK